MVSNAGKPCPKCGKGTLVFATGDCYCYAGCGYREPHDHSNDAGYVCTCFQKVFQLAPQLPSHDIIDISRWLYSEHSGHVLHTQFYGDEATGVVIAQTRCVNCGIVLGTAPLSGKLDDYAGVNLR